MDAYDEKSQSYLANKRAFTDFLTNEVDGVYQRRITAMLKNEETRLIVNIDDLRRFDPELARRVLDTPMQYLAPFMSSLKEYVLSLNIASSQGLFTEDDHPRKDTDVSYTVGIDGNFGGLKVSPRQLSADHLGKLVCVEGIATRCSIVRPKVQRTVHFCEKTGVHSEMTYHDATSISGFPTSSIYPTKDLDGNPLTTEFGLCKYQDHQTLVIQEMPERAPAGLLPSSVDVVLDDDLVDTCKPGDRVAIIGIYRALPSKSQGATSGIFKTVLIANHVRHLGKSIGSNATITPTDTGNIRQIARRKDVFELLGRSVAPSIFGHDFIKKALVLLLLGGVEKNLENGTHIRGDINMLFVGDPSTSKSQMLRFILNIAPLALNTTGRGSSGVGLTAAVTQDKETGERRLEAGAMVLADRGVVCIDEFDKMSDADRVAIHEVMEQQTVTIAKAGIHMSLNARCSVVAAANPRYSQYDSTKPPNWNVNLPDSLLSRFDFLFIILDTPDPEHDRAIADKVLSNHRYRRGNGAGNGGAAGRDGGATGVDDEEEDVDYNTLRNGESEAHDSEVFQRFDKLLHGGLVRRAAGHGGRQAKTLDILSIPFMKKYIAYAKSIEPVLSPEAADFIGQAYAELRKRAQEGSTKEHSFPITARTLETLIRLSTAHAKARLDGEVRVEDCEEVLKILRYAIEHDTGVQAKKQAGDADDGEEERKSDDDNDDDDQDDDEDMGDSARSPASNRRGSRRRAIEEDDDEEEEEKEFTPARTPSKRGSPSKRKKATGSATPKSKKARTTTASVPGSGSSRMVTAVDEMEDDEDAGSSSADAFSASPPAPAAAAAPRAGAPSSARYQELQRHLVAYMKSLRLDMVTFKAFMTSLDERPPEEAEPFTEEEVEHILTLMEKENSVMYRKGQIFKI